MRDKRALDGFDSRQGINDLSSGSIHSCVFGISLETNVALKRETRIENVLYRFPLPIVFPGNLRLQMESQCDKCDA